MELEVINWFTAPTNIVIAGAAIVALILSTYQYFQGRRMLRLQSMLQLFNQYIFDLHNDRSQVNLNRNMIIQESEKKGATFSNIVEPLRSYVIRLSHFYDMTGSLLYHGYVDEKLVIAFLGKAALDYYKVIRPLIKNERTERSDDLYQNYFEDFATRCREKKSWEKVKFARFDDVLSV